MDGLNAKKKRQISTDMLYYIYIYICSPPPMNYLFGFEYCQTDVFLGFSRPFLFVFGEDPTVNVRGEDRDENLSLGWPEGECPADNAVQVVSFSYANCATAL